MKRYFIFGLLLFIGFAVAFAPAGLIDRGVDQIKGVDLLDPTGTLWQGRGGLQILDQPAGDFRWRFNPVVLLSLKGGYDWQIEDPNAQIDGATALGIAHVDLTLEARLRSAYFQPWLQSYNLTIEGEFDLKPTEIVLEHRTGRIEKLDGQLLWSGGEISYGLGGVTQYTRLPPLTAFLQQNGQGEPEAVVYAEGSDTPLIIASPGAPGFVKIGMTKKFSSLLGRPWPGRAADHEVVLQVEEQLF